MYRIHAGQEIQRKEEVIQNLQRRRARGRGRAYYSNFNHGRNQYLNYNPYVIDRRPRNVYLPAAPLHRAPMYPAPAIHPSKVAHGKKGQHRQRQDPVVPIVPTEKTTTVDEKGKQDAKLSLQDNQLLAKLEESEKKQSGELDSLKKEMEKEREEMENRMSDLENEMNSLRKFIISSRRPKRGKFGRKL